MHTFGKWSMLDVFIVAILVVSVKLGAIASVEMRYGLYAFATAVVLKMYTAAINRRMRPVFTSASTGLPEEDIAIPGNG